MKYYAHLHFSVDKKFAEEFKAMAARHKIGLSELFRKSFGSFKERDREFLEKEKKEIDELLLP